MGFLVLLGLYLTARGYRSFEGDQAYRFPILRHAQDNRLFDGDPFVRSFDRFNPHRGYFALLDAVSRPAGLAAALATLYGLTFAVTAIGLDRLARSVWKESGVGIVAVAMVLLAQAGNVGTNHLFEPILLDRLIAFGLGWVALSAWVGAPGREGWVAPVAVGLAALVHPSVGLQTAALLIVSWFTWGLLGLSEGTSRLRRVLIGLAVAAAVVPGLLLNLRDSGLLLEGLPADQVRLLAAELQSPQHMLPHLWRTPQWLAWGCYPLLAAVAMVTERVGPSSTVELARRRLAVSLAVLLAGLGLAWFGVERLGNLRLTLFQPFRMATVARGLCLILVAGHAVRIWRRGGVVNALRAVFIGVGLTGDWRLVVVSLFELSMSAADWCGSRRPVRGLFQTVAFLILLAGLNFLSRHDTESGHVPLLGAAAATLALYPLVRRQEWGGNGRRLAFRAAAAWVVPIAAVGANLVPEEGLSARARSVRQALVSHCRFAEVPVDDVERLAVWCRENTPTGARFIGPPGPKTFRLWSLRSLAFNRAGSPYAAAGLGDWARRFADHVGLSGSPEILVAEYLNDRHSLESRYDSLSADGLVALARRQGADHVLAVRPGRELRADARLRPLRVEGRYTVYRVDPPPAVASSPAGLIR
jgi:hypothetical protein